MAQDDSAIIAETFKWALAHPGAVFTNMGIVGKLTVMIAVICLIIGAVTAVISRLRNAPRSGFLSVLGVIGLVSGLLGAAYGGLTTFLAVQQLHVTRVAIYLPSLIEIGFCALVGLLAWLVAQMGNAGAKRQ